MAQRRTSPCLRGSKKEVFLLTPKILLLDRLSGTVASLKHYLAHGSFHPVGKTIPRCGKPSITRAPWATQSFTRLSPLSAFWSLVCLWHMVSRAFASRVATSCL